MIVQLDPDEMSVLERCARRAGKSVSSFANDLLMVGLHRFLLLEQSLAAEAHLTAQPPATGPDGASGRVGAAVVRTPTGRPRARNVTTRK